MCATTLTVVWFSYLAGEVDDLSGCRRTKSDSQKSSPRIPANVQDGVAERPLVELIPIGDSTQFVRAKIGVPVHVEAARLGSSRVGVVTHREFGTDVCNRPRSAQGDVLVAELAEARHEEPEDDTVE